jgi:cation diffusion facilitator family transporter
MVLPRGVQFGAQEKKRAALLSIGSAGVLLCLKTFLVATTGSLGVLSEALHSGLDLIAAIITFLSVRVSDEPADEKHPYGHGKFENFSAFVETGLLLLTALFIIYEAFSRLFFHHVHIEPSLTAIVILLVALAIDLTRARTLNKVAKKYESEALEADALHFSTDVWSTVVVILGIALVWAGNVWNVPWLGYADALAGLAVAGVFCGSARNLAGGLWMRFWMRLPKGCRTKLPTRYAGWMECWTWNAFGCDGLGTGTSWMRRFPSREQRAWSRYIR